MTNVPFDVLALLPHRFNHLTNCGCHRIAFVTFAVWVGQLARISIPIWCHNPLCTNRKRPTKTYRWPQCVLCGLRRCVSRWRFHPLCRQMFHGRYQIYRMMLIYYCRNGYSNIITEDSQMTQFPRERCSLATKKLARSDGESTTKSNLHFQRFDAHFAFSQEVHPKERS